jgi:hypothetical protein
MPLAVLAVCAGAVAPARAQVAVVAVKSIDALRADVRYVLGMAGQEERARQLDELIKSLTGEKGLAGLDTQRPFGAYVNLPAKLGMNPPAVAFLPVTKEEDLLGLLDTLGIPVSKPENGVRGIDLPGGQKAYFRFAHRYVYVSDTAANLGGNLPDPAKLFQPDRLKDNLLTAALRFDEVPKHQKQLLLSLIDTQIAAEQERKPGESDNEYQSRLAATKLARDVLGSLVEESGALTFDLRIDQKANRIAFDLALVPKAGTVLAGRFRTFTAGRSPFQGLLADAAAGLVVHVPVADELRRELVQLFTRGVEEGLKNEKDPQRRALAKKLHAALLPTLEAGVIDFGAALLGPRGDDKKFVGVLGVKVAEGKKLEEVFLELVKLLPAEEKGRVKLAQAEAGGVKVHVIQAGKSLPDAQAEKVFGPFHFVLAFRDDVLLVTMGEHGLEVMKETIAALDRPAAGAAPPVQLELAVARVALLNLEERERIEQALAKAFPGGPQGRDRVRVTLQGGDALRLRFEAPAEIIRVIAELAPAMQ